MLRELGKGSIVVFFIVLFRSLPVWAGGMEIPANGTRNLSRGGANVASVSDPSAIVNNPAGLAGIRGASLLFDNNLVMSHLCFQQYGTYPGEPGPNTYAGQPYPKVCRMNKGAFYIPMVAATYDFGLDDWTFAIGGYGPHSPSGRKHFPRQVTVRDSLGSPVRAPGPTRYQVLNQDVLVIFFTAAAAWRPVPWLDVGVALQPTLSDAKLTMSVPYNSDILDPDDDIFFAVHTKGFAFSALFGTKVRPFKNMEVGLSARLPIHSVSKGDATIQLPPGMLGFAGPLLTFTGDTEVEMISDLPLVVRSGVRYRWLMGDSADSFEIADLELDFQWERWSVVRSIDTIVHGSVLGSRELATFRLAHFYKDTISLRLGGTFTVPRLVLGGRLGFSLGVYYDSEASPLEYTRLDYQAFSFIGFGTGLFYRIRGMEFHLAFSYVVGGSGWPWNFDSKRKVERSCIKPVDAFNSPDLERCDPSNSSWRESTDIGRGETELSYFVASLGFVLYLDDMLSGGRR